MKTILLSLCLAVICVLSTRAAAEVADAPFFHCVAWDNISVGQACFKAAYDQCGVAVAVTEQAECVDAFNALSVEEQGTPGVAAEYCTEWLERLTEATLCPTPLPLCNAIRSPQPCRSPRSR